MLLAMGVMPVTLCPFPLPSALFSFSFTFLRSDAFSSLLRLVPLGEEGSDKEPK